ncbi:ArsR family transcriptional regulator [Candidatus Lokiarchaeum ossiferum]
MNPIRIQILQILNEEDQNLSKLATKIGLVSNSEISRHLSRLGEQSLIRKERETGRYYQITAFGKAIMNSLDNFVFLSINSDYFTDHSIADIPLSLQSQISVLQNAEIISGTGNVMHKIKEFMELPIKKLRIIVDSGYPFLNTEAEISVIVPESMNTTENQEDPSLKSFKIGLLPSVPITMALCDLEIGIIAFPRESENNPDVSKCFYIQDPQGIKFLEQIWVFFWDKAQKISN